MIDSNGVVFSNDLVYWIKEYQKSKSPGSFDKILRRIDKLLIKIINEIYRSNEFYYLNSVSPDELYNTAILGLDRALVKCSFNESFTIYYFAGLLKAYIKAEYRKIFFKETIYVSIDLVDTTIDKHEHNYEFRDQSIKKILLSSLLDLKEQLLIPGIGFDILKCHLIDEMSYRKVSSKLNVKLSLVSYWLNKGKKLLRENGKLKEIWENI